MGKHTIRSGRIDREIEKQVNIVTDEIKKSTPDAISILLVGGYGRGEGAFLVRGGKPMPVNDLDMYVITDKRYSDSYLEDIKQLQREGEDILEQALSVNGVDRNRIIEKAREECKKWEEAGGWGSGRCWDIINKAT